eukprot:CAMPEP_0175225752 /NCGR_PEP_ID=MMETSP0093-20121207/22543_1 /TAXON_ID=311494 /ORGANISM="Alexandrium monilatum, Strain CCMP3105" /LENGTH=30 /DNA_ID= /DNA_START= /DNA_END= /DNA_ORIENTATION=
MATEPLEPTRGGEELAKGAATNATSSCVTE